MAARVPRHGKLRPSPLGQRPRPELEPPRRRRKTLPDHAVHLDAHPAPPFLVPVERRQRHHIRRWRRRRPCERPPGFVNAHVVELALRHTLLVDRPHRRVDLERPVAAHVLERRPPLPRGLLGQARHRVLENPPVVLVHGHLLARLRARLEELPDPARAVRVDPPRQLDPELVLLPHLAGVHVAGGPHLLAEPLPRGPQNRLAEADPAPIVLLVRGEVVPLRRVPHRQHVVRKERCLVPRRGQRHMQPYTLRVREHLDPGEAVGVGPDGVVDAGEIDVQVPVSLRRQVRQQERHLHEAQREIRGPRQVVPALRVLRRHPDRAGHELVPRVGKRPAGNRDRPEQRVQEKEHPRDLPSAQVAGRGASPVVGGQPGTRARDDLRHRFDGTGRDAALGGREVEGIVHI